MKPFVIYFPQFYRTKTNDAAWGLGFSDWVLVAFANMTGKWVRRAPMKGFYDGSSADIFISQVREMEAHEIGGMGLYHYWFSGKRELVAAEEFLQDPSLKFPWFLIWANESWTKRWIGDDTILLDLNPTPSISEITEHCSYLVHCFDNPSYFRVDGRPLFVFYNAGFFANPGEVVKQYRQVFSAFGVEVVFGQFIKNPADLKFAPFFEINYCFEPRLFFGFDRASRGRVARWIFDRVRSVVSQRSLERIMLFLDKFQRKGASHTESSFLEYINSQSRANFLVDNDFQEVLSPGWNNFPRYGDRFTELKNLDPKQFASLVYAKSANPKFPVLINAWNEWSEGAAIEPCSYLGDAYLRELSNAFRSLEG